MTRITVRAIRATVQLVTSLTTTLISRLLLRRDMLNDVSVKRRGFHAHVK